QEQQHAVWRGLRRLLLLNIPAPIKYLHENLPNRAELRLCLNPYGKILDLIHDWVSCCGDKRSAENGRPVWSEAGFAQHRDK
ncbi:DUF3418 domain-containing protein, partial [Cronobacter sakazakii]|uniref:DUF3418 domain-containing protein n=1 Tax=Cronobacter sakazakii TaxID=28141 RepID=UPI000D4C2715